MPLFTRYVEKEKAKLEEEKKAAEAYIKLCNEHARARSKLYQWNLYRDFEVQKKLERELVRIVFSSHPVLLGRFSSHGVLLVAALIWIRADATSFSQTQWQTRLEEEREQNKDDVKHLEELEKGFQEKQALYEVRLFCRCHRLPTSLRVSLILIWILQTVQATADALYKEIAGMTKNEVTLQERQKHVRTKLKKEKKKLGEVRLSALFPSRLLLTVFWHVLLG